MGIKTSKAYLESLKKLKPEVYIGGERIDDVVSSKYFKISLEEMCKFYDWANDPEKEKDFVFWSPVIDEKVSFWTHLRRTPEEVRKIIETLKKNNARHFCSMCMITGLNVLWAVTYDIDQARGTNYHERLKNFFRELQKDDLRYCMGVMDPKGDRSLPPSRQADPDLYLRVVDKNKDGIIVNGAKMHTSDAPITHYIFTCPSGVLQEADKDYAVSFAIPIDTKGLKFITRPAPGPLEPKEMESPASSHIGFVECLSVFDHVFIPWERVFMCGEWEFTENLIRYFSPYVRICKGACTSARTDILAGTAALIAHYNGVGKAGHIRSKITDMMISSEMAGAAPSEQWRIPSCIQAESRFRMCPSPMPGFTTHAFVSSSFSAPSRKSPAASSPPCRARRNTGTKKRGNTSKNISRGGATSPPKIA